MDFFYEYLNSFPEFMQRYIAALLIIIIGYFLSKIFSALAGSITSKLTSSPYNPQTDVRPLYLHIGKITFWSSWLIFIWMAALEFPELEVPQISPSSWKFGYSNDFLVMLVAAFILLLSESNISRLYESFKTSLSSIPFSKDSFIFRSITRYIWLPIIAFCIFALALPDTTLSNKAVMTLLVLVIGWLMSNVVKQTIISLIEPFGAKSESWPKFFSYFIFVHFFIAAISLWR